MPCICGGQPVATEACPEPVKVLAVLEPGAVLFQPVKPALAEERVPARQVIAAELIEEDEHGQARPRHFFLGRP
jgi:hypothetical protein